MTSNKPLIKLKGKVQDMNKVVKNEKAKYSNFLLTINTNQQYKEGDENMENDIEVFENCIKEVLSSAEQYIKLPEGVEWNDDNIKDVDIDYVIEKGTKKNQIHVHILFKIKHTTKVLLDYPKIKKKICDDLGLDNVYMLNKLVKNSGDINILEYINKYV